jgi:hypothetical protein
MRLGFKRALMDGDEYEVSSNNCYGDTHEKAFFAYCTSIRCCLWQSGMGKKGSITGRYQKGV